MSGSWGKPHPPEHLHFTVLDAEKLKAVFWAVRVPCGFDSEKEEMGPSYGEHKGSG